jgi:WD repeat-containing protein 35
MDESSSQLCVAYKCGRMQLMRKENDEAPILVDTGMHIKGAKWNPNGNVIAIVGSLADNSDGKGIV